MRSTVFRFAIGCISGLLLLLSAPACSNGETRSVEFKPSDSGAAPQYSRPLMGANTHFGTVRILGYTSAAIAREQLAEIGATSFRDYLPWQSFAFPPSGPVLVKSRRLMKFLNEQTELKPLINLGLTNSFVKGGVPPVSDEGLRYFESYIGKAVEETRSYQPIYEIWNEWNMSIGTGERMPALSGEGDPSDPRAAIHYARIAKTAVREIRKANPKAMIVVGAVGDDTDWAWARAIVRYGSLENADGLSVHLYNQCARVKTATELIERVKGLQAMLVKQRGTETPIYVTEFGWPTSDGNCGMPYDISADYFAQFILQAATIPWIKGIWMHELKNISPDPVDRESNFGLFTYDNKPKPAVCFMREAIRIVKSADYLDLRQPFKDVFVLKAKSGQRQQIVLWASSEDVDARYTLPDGFPPGRTMCGDKVLAAADGNPIGTAPVIYEVPDSQAVSLNVTN